MALYSDRIIKNGNGIVRINHIVSTKVENGVVVQYEVDFSVWDSKRSDRKYTRIANLKDVDSDLFAFKFENEEVTFVYHNRYVK